MERMDNALDALVSAMAKQALIDTLQDGESIECDI